MGLSGAIVILLMRETNPSRRRLGPAWQGHPEWIYGPAAGLPSPFARRAATLVQIAAAELGSGPGEFLDQNRLPEAVTS